MAKQLPVLTGSIRRLAAAAATAMAVAIVLTGCAAGQDAQTVNQQPPIDGASANAGDLAIRTAAVVASDTGDAYAKGGSALLQLVVVNSGGSAVKLNSVSTSAATDAIVSNIGVPSLAAEDTSSPSDSASSSAAASSSTSASSSAGATASTTGSASASASAPVSTPIEIGAGQSMQIGFSAVGANILLTGLTEPLYPAQGIPVTFTFDNGRSINVTVPVQLSSNPPSAPVVSDATEPVENNN